MTAYIVCEVEVTDPEVAARYRALSSAAVAEFGGTYVVGPQPPQMLEGEWDPRRVLLVLTFDDVERAREWYDSEAYAEAKELGKQCMTRRLAMVDGVPAPSAGAHGRS